jgi:hypothetical protein
LEKSVGRRRASKVEGGSVKVLQDKLEHCLTL